MTIDELITYCEEKEYNHRLSCKRYDGASGYARSKDKNIRTACAIREEKYADYYKEISATMRKYQKMQAEYEIRLKADMVAMLTDLQFEIEELDPCGNEWNDSLDACNDIIQQKINELKSESEDKE